MFGTYGYSKDRANDSGDNSNTGQRGITGTDCSAKGTVVSVNFFDGFMISIVENKHHSLFSVGDIINVTLLFLFPIALYRGEQSS